MKTIPNAESDTYSFALKDSSAIPQLTENSKGKLVKCELKEETKDLIGDGPINGLDCGSDFSFEKSRIKAIENTSLFASLTTNSQTNKLTEVINTAFKRKNYIEETKGKLVNVLKSLCIIFTLIGTGNILVIFFGMIFLSISNIPLANFVFYFSFEICSVIVFIIVSINGSNVDRFTLPALNKYLKITIIYATILMSILLYIVIKENPKTLFRKAVNWGEANNSQDDNIRSIVCIVIICIMFSILYKVIALIIYTVICCMYKKKMTDEITQELKILKDTDK